MILYVICFGQFVFIKAFNKNDNDLIVIFLIKIRLILSNNIKASKIKKENNFHNAAKSFLILI